MKRYNLIVQVALGVSILANFEALFITAISHTTNSAFTVSEEMKLVHQSSQSNKISHDWGESFEKVEKTYCVGMYGSYSNFSEAILSCKNDTKCKAVFNIRCDVHGHFRLCNTSNFRESKPKNSSCVYKKNEDFSNWLISDNRIIAAAVVLVAIVIIIVWIYYRRNKNKVEYSDLTSKLKSEDKSENIISNGDLKSQAQNLPYNTKREIKRSCFILESELGHGNFGQVHKGVLKGLYSANSSTPVAIKSIQKYGDKQNLRDFICEIKLMSRIKPHPNLVSMIGSCSSELSKHGKLWLLLEFCENGDLKNYLQNNKMEITFGNESDQINSRCLLKWSYGIAKGMHYLAQNQIMHGDLAARNVLMSEDPLKSKCLLVKIADFGLAKKIYGDINYEKKSRLLVPWKWMALEYLKQDFFTLKSDVWSFGVLLWEILSFGSNPYGQLDYDEVIEKLERGYRLPCPREADHCESWSPVLLYNQLSKICFLADPENRASFLDVVRVIENTLSSNEKKCYEQMCEVYESTRAVNYLKIGNKSK